MRIQDQVCSIKQAKRLKEYGISPDSLFCFIGDDNPDPKYNLPHKLYLTTEAYSECGAGWYENRIAAFTVAELGIMMPTDVISYPILIDHPEKGFSCSKIKITRTCFHLEVVPPAFDGQTEAEARAALLINYLENGRISVDEVNSRLKSEVAA